MIKKVNVVCVCLCAIALFSCGEKAKADLSKTPDKQGYAVGYTMGARINSNELKLPASAIAAGFQDGLRKKGQLSDNEIQKTFNEFQQARTQAIIEARQKEVAQNMPLIQEFKAKDAKEKGILSLPNGVQYKSLIQVSEGQSPRVTDKVIVQYKGFLAANGQVFDSTYQTKKPVEFVLNKAMPGLQSAVQKMKIGESWRVYIPAKLGYGNNPVASIPANSDLVYEIELVGVTDEAAQNLFLVEDFTVPDFSKRGVLSLASGVKYKKLNTVEQGKSPLLTDKVTVHYKGYLASNGQVFDSSYVRQQPAQFALNQVIAGWQDALKNMKEGEAWRIYIPSKLAYGNKAVSTIPANSDLVFDVELLKIN